MNKKLEKWYERAKHFISYVAIFYPIAQAYLRGKGYDLPDLGDYTAKTQILGAALLAQSKKVSEVVKKA